MTQPTAETPPTMRFPESGDFPSGPEVGDLVPDFTLPDQDGNEVSLREVLEGGQAGHPKALLVFIRATSW